MMLEFENLSSRERMPISVLSLYLRAFPADERRTCRSLFELIDGRNADFSFRVIRTDGVIAGFITVWSAPEFRYIEHFAIAEEIRGRGIGGLTIEKLLREDSRPLLLEVEPPQSGTGAERRVGFYRRHGLKPHLGVDYLQPAYAPDRSEVSMVLMTSGDIDLDAAIAYLRAKVYGVKN